MSCAGYSNLQVHSELISPSAPLLIRGGYNWMLINHRPGITWHATAVKAVVNAAAT